MGKEEVGAARRAIVRHQGIRRLDAGAQELVPGDGDQIEVRGGHMFGSIGKHDDALADFNKLVEMDQNDFNSYYSRGYEYLENNNFHKAILDFNLLVKLHPQDSLAYNSRGYAYGCAGQYKKSISDFNSAIDLGDQYSYVERAEINAKLGKKQKTITDYKEFLRLSEDPEMVQQVKQKLDKLINK